MMRILAWIMAALLGLVLIAAAFYVFVVHPNDERIAMPPWPAAPGERLHSYGTLLTGSWPHQVEPIAGYDDAKRAFAEAQTGAVMTQSKRFVSPYQIYLSVGEYPLRLEAHDGIYVPNNGVLTIVHGTSEEREVRFAAYADGVAGKVTLRQANGFDRTLALEQPVAAPPARGFFYRQLLRFLWPDRDDEIRRWRTFSARLPLQDRFEIACTDAPLGCVIGDVRLYAPASSSATRNVLMLLVDTMRGDATAGGHAPRLAGLAAEGTTFTRALAPGNMTSPSTNALLSCRMAAQLGSMAFAYAVTQEHREGHYAKGSPSFPDTFRRSGFRTAMIGNVSVISEVYGVGVHHGFDQQISIETDAYDTPLITRSVVEWLSQNGDTPFFLYVHLHGPHAPYRAPLRDVTATYPGTGGFESYPQLLRWLYQSEIHYTDRYFGRILDGLGRLGLAATTDIVVTADHGDMHTNHRFSGNEVAPNFTGAYFDHGATLLNDEIRVPLIFRGGGVKAGHVVPEVVSTLDVGPTLLARKGLPVHDYCQGANLSVPLSGAAPNPELVKRTMGSEAFQGRAIVLDGRYKYVRMYTAVDKRVYSEGSFHGPKQMYYRREQLYDLTTDPSEEIDLIDELPDIAARSRQEYAAFYGIGRLYELVVESPEGAPIEIRVPPIFMPTVVVGDVKATVEGAGSLLKSTESKRVVVELRAEGALPGGPSGLDVRVGDAALRLKQTGMRLPLIGLWTDLPLESGGAQTLLPLGSTAQAYVRLVDDDGQKDRRISVGNPAFDKILREWGYLND